jgi:hypothetical protein
MRKFGCNILAVVQQYDIIKDSAVRGAMIGNSKMLLKLNYEEPLEIISPVKFWNSFQLLALAQIVSESAGSSLAWPKDYLST